MFLVMQVILLKLGRDGWGGCSDCNDACVEKGGEAQSKQRE